MTKPTKRILIVAGEASADLHGSNLVKAINELNGDIHFYGIGGKKIKKMGDVRTRYYVHFSAIDRPGVLSKISGILGSHDISIASVVQKERREAHVVPIVMLTHEAREKDMQAALKKIDNLSAIKRKSVLLRLES